MLIVPAPIKTAYIWDIAPGSSAVERCLSADLQIYLVNWERPQRGDEWMGLAEYADRSLRDCLDTIAAETGQNKVLLAGHSLGGTLAAVFASLHPGRVRGLIELEGPMAFGAGRLDSMVAGASRDSASAVASENIPGSFLDWASFCADPLTFGAEPWRDWLESSRSAADIGLHLRVRRWSLDERPMARQLFEEVKEGLYRENRFAERRLHVGQRLADPRAIDAPMLGVFEPRSRIVPPSAIEAYRHCTSSPDVALLDYPGDRGVMLRHVGVLVGRNAHEAVWPRILNWISKLGGRVPGRTRVPGKRLTEKAGPARRRRSAPRVSHENPTVHRN
jgi:polyhydroxyalkanoate synthase subunit PhaC